MNEESVKSLIEFSNSVFRLKENAIMRMLTIVNEYARLKQKPENESLYQFNLLDMVPVEEPHTSKFLCSILNYTENGTHIILTSFVDRFLSLVGLDKSRIKRPVITAEKSHVDVRILDNDYAVIIENKLMNAPFQRNQLGRYIEDTHRLGFEYENIFVVIIPQYFDPELVDGIRSSVWKCPSDGLSSSNASRCCAHYDQYLCWCDDKCRTLNSDEINHCDRCIDFYPSFKDRTIVIHAQLSDWLLEVNQTIDPKQITLRSAIHQFADFTKGLFDTRINNNLLMDIKKLIKESFLPPEASAITQWNILHDKSVELNEIQSALSAMKVQLSKDLVDEWYHELKSEFVMIKREVQKSFGINIMGVWVGCWCGSNNNGCPYWGFYCENKGTAEQQAMVREILAECDMHSSKSTTNYISWDNTRHGAERCRNFYNAAKRLGYLS